MTDQVTRTKLINMGLSLLAASVVIGMAAGVGDFYVSGDGHPHAHPARADLCRSLVANKKKRRAPPSGGKAGLESLGDEARSRGMNRAITIKPQK